MGMFNAIIPDELLNPTGVYKERLSQSALCYESTQVGDDEALAVRRWMDARHRLELASALQTPALPTTPPEAATAYAPKDDGDDDSVSRARTSSTTRDCSNGSTQAPCVSSAAYSIVNGVCTAPKITTTSGAVTVAASTSPELAFGATKASSTASDVGSGTVSTRTSARPCQVTARM